MTAATAKGKALTLVELPPSLRKADSGHPSNTHPTDSTSDREVPQRKESPDGLQEWLTFRPRDGLCEAFGHTTMKTE